ncbi:hypothetical protein H9L21_11280 [Aeromicrobium senzhongii]|uniref:Restriction endonuclease AspBHI N-terminal domain-containing protein n=1 Tax=Aeromicrobium senzhongii TaxID=2663859 RepID=A0ABX6SRL8_9ACTN|nr:hypothetical protein [Aeromicrobium senzhongii]MTB89041.1 hypothetical protein [Aeromicrobium senzhongii]QNL93686.1 hypothetical protein H9L21_11280 [Aeromicrobium senzhongii]
MTTRLMRPGSSIRYTKALDTVSPLIDGYPNFHWLMNDPERPQGALPRLEKGIDAPAAVVDAYDEVRRPLVSCRTSTHKAGTETTPWHDRYDPETGTITYFGDNKPGSMKPAADAPGNRRLIETAELHASDFESDRAVAPPVLAFSFGRKGVGTFLGVCVIDNITLVRQTAGDGGLFSNFKFELAVLDTGIVDPRWFDDRRDPWTSTEECMRHAPMAWRLWVEAGSEALEELRAGY